MPGVFAKFEPPHQIGRNLYGDFCVKGISLANALLQSRP
jgi:hypothetical protein